APSVATLCLSGDRLGKLHGPDLARVIRAIPKQVTLLDLRGNGFNRLKGDALCDLFELLLLTGKRIHIEEPVATLLCEAQRIAFLAGMKKSDPVSLPYRFFGDKKHHVHPMGEIRLVDKIMDYASRTY